MIIPRAGDTWEYKMNGRKKKKTIDYISWDWYIKSDNSEVKRPTVNWKRFPKGRYSSIRVKWLLKHGTLIRRKSA